MPSTTTGIILKAQLLYVIEEDPETKPWTFLLLSLSLSLVVHGPIIEGNTMANILGSLDHHIYFGLHLKSMIYCVMFLMKKSRIQPSKMSLKFMKYIYVYDHIRLCCTAGHLWADGCTIMINLLCNYKGF